MAGQLHSQHPCAMLVSQCFVTGRFSAERWKTIKVKEVPALKDRLSSEYQDLLVEDIDVASLREWNAIDIPTALTIQGWIRSNKPVVPEPGLCSYCVSLVVVYHLG